MKIKLLSSLTKFVLILSGVLQMTHATDLAIKLDLTQNAKKNIIGPIVSQKTFTGQDAQKIVKNPHVTIGFVSGLKDQAEGHKIGKFAENFISTYLTTHPLNFDVLTCENLGKHTVLKATLTSEAEFQKLNAALSQQLQTTYGISFNALTQPGNYTAHLTLKNNSTGPNKLLAINKYIDGMRKNGSLYFKIDQASYSVK